MTKLELFLKDLTSKRMLHETSRRADEALNSFLASWTLEECKGGFSSVPARFYRDVLKSVLRLPADYEGDLAFEDSAVREILKKKYGPNGHMAAWDVWRTGQEGGQYRILRDIAQGLAEECIAREIAARVGTFLDGLTVEDQIAAAREYIEKYSHLLPTEHTEGGAVRLVARFSEVLKEHPRILARFERVGR